MEAGQHENLLALAFLVLLLCATMIDARVPRS
jgi:hypothetical protein